MHVLSRLLQKCPIFINNSLKYGVKLNLRKVKPLKTTLSIFGFSCCSYYLGSILFCNSILIANCLSINEHEKYIDANYEKPVKLSYIQIWQPTYFDIIIFALSILSAVAAAVINIQIPLKLGSVVNVLSKLQSNDKNNFFDKLKFPSFDLLVCYAIQAISTTSYISLLSIIGERLAMNMKKRLFERIIMQDAKFFDTVRSGDLLNRITADVQDFKSSFKQCVSQGLRSFITIVGSTIALVLVSKELTTVVIIAVPSLVLFGSVMGRILRVLSRDAQIQNSKVAEVANEGISNVRTVKSFAMEDKEIEKFDQEVNLAGRLHSNLGVGIGIFQGLSNLAINGMVLGLLFVGGYMMSIGNLTPGDLMSFLVASQTIQKSLSTLSTLFGHLVKANASGTRISEFLALGNCITSPNLYDLQNRRQIKQEESIVDKPLVSVEFRNIFFAYPTRNEQVVLKDFSLFIPKGSVTALCGESGAGKSTVASLMQRLYDPISGEILLNKTNIRDISVSELRSDNIGLVSQHPQLFAKSIRENIRYAKIKATDEEVEEAAKQAQAHEFIMGFQQGYDTMVGERGGEALSGGQRQRIAIAQVILKNPNVLILDEATSALDSKSEELVQKALKNVMKGRTVIVIAHRLSTIQFADQIVVLKNGQIVEIGPHEELLQKKGQYYELVKKMNKPDS